MDKYIIYAGRAWKHNFRVVSDDGVTAEVLDPTDTATLTISTAGATPTCILSNIPMTLLDATNGLFEASLTAEQTVLLKQKVGFQEDGYSAIGNYDGYMEFTLVSGNRQASIIIGVQEIPVCPA